MAPSRLLLLPVLALTAPLATAKIGFEGCTSTTTTWTYSHDIVLYYLPDTGEVCDNPDCGGGRAPPKTDKPWCGNYKGTTTYSPMFIDLPTPTAVTTTTTSAAPEPEETEDTDTDMATPTTFLTSSVRETGDSTSSGAVLTQTQSENVTAAPSGTDASSPVETSQAESSDDEDQTVSPSGTDEDAPEETGAAAGLRVAAGMMAGLAAVAVGALAL